MFLANLSQLDGLPWPSFSFATPAGAQNAPNPATTLFSGWLPWLLILLLLLTLFILYRRYRNTKNFMRLRVSELEALSDAGRVIVEAQLDLQALCELIAHEASKVIDTSTFQIGLFERDLGRDLYRILFWTINGKRQSPRSFDLSENAGIVGWVRDTRQTLTIKDYEREIDQLPARPRYVSPNPPRSSIFIPLRSGSNTLGVVAAQSAEPNRFTANDVRRLTILANQAAAAIAHAYLYELERTRAAHLELVGQIARQVNAIQDLDDMMHQVVALTRSTFGFHPVSILNLADDADEAELVASTWPELEAAATRVPAGFGIIGTAISQRRSIVANETQTDRRFEPSLPHLRHIQPDTQAEIAIPLIVNQELLGVLDVQSSQPGVFGLQEQLVLEALAAQAATAIHKARQWAAQREQAWLTTAQLQVADAINQSMSMDDLLAVLVRLTPLLVGVESCGILLWDEELQLYQGSDIYGYPAATAAQFRQLRLAIGQWNPLDAVHVGMEKLITSQPPPWQPNNGNTLTGLFPLAARGRMVGVMSLSGPPRPNSQTPAGICTPRQEELLNSIALQAAQAIIGEQLNIAQQEEAWVNTALLQVAEAVNSLIELNEILDTIVRFIPILVGIDTCLILVWDERSRTFRPGPSHGINEMGRGLLQSFEIDETELPLLEPQEESRLLVTTFYTFHLPPWLQTLFDSPTASALPLFARAKLVGALVISPPRDGRPISGRRLNILTGIGQQAAIAVVNDQLYRESAERSRLEQELDVARSIQASFIPSGSPHISGCTVASYWEAARQVSGDFYDFLPLPSGRWGIVVADVADKGVPAALFMALSRTVLRTIAMNRNDPAVTLERANEIICHDTTSDLFVTVFYAIWDPDKRVLAYGNAGHNPPLLLRRDGRTKLLHGTGMALGVLDSIEIEAREVRLRPGDILILYTDGVTEAVNEDYDEFGLERLRLTVAAHQDEDAESIKQAITAAIRDFAGDTSQFDDVTLVVMKLDNG